MFRKPYFWLRGKIAGLSELRDKPHSVAIGVASGIFFGFAPFFGFKTLLAMGVAKLARGSMVAAAVAVTLHDVILPLAPVILRWEYQIGYWLLSHPHHLPPGLNAGHLKAGVWFHWSTLFDVALPLIVGSVFIGLPFGAAAYFLTLRMLERAAARKNPAA